MGELESIREKLNLAIERGKLDLTSPDILEISKTLDELILKEYYGDLYKN